METQRPNKVLLFPWIAKGHVTPYLELAKKLAKRNVQVYLCSSPIILESISKLLAKHHHPQISPTIHLIELPLPSSPELPPHHHTTTALPPHLITMLQMAFQETKRAFYDIISTLNPGLLIYDGFQPWAASHASSLNIPSVHLITTGAVTMSHFLHLFHVDEIKCDEFRFLPIHCHDDPEMKKFVEMCGRADEEDVTDIGVLCFKSLHLSKGFILINTCSEIEEKYIKYLSLLTKKEVIPIGPLIRERDDDEHKEIMEWLQEKEESSCVLASFGSEHYMSNKEIKEIARGLELSGMNFIWSLKFPTGVDTSVEEAMPRGYLERVKHKGLMVKGWVPQTKILNDRRICGFLSHCGWNSVLESLASGVPIIALPIHLDQPINARLIEEIGVGVEVVKGENGEIKGEELAKALRKVVMVEKKGGEALIETSMNSKAKELSERMKLRGDKVIDGAVDKLLQLCKGKN